MSFQDYNYLSQDDIDPKTGLPIIIGGGIGPVIPPDTTNFINMQPNYLDLSPAKKSNRALIIGLSVGGGVLLLLIIAFIIYYRHIKKGMAYAM